MIEASEGVGLCPTKANADSYIYQQGWAMPNNTIVFVTGLRAGLGSAHSRRSRSKKGDFSRFENGIIVNFYS